MDSLKSIRIGLFRQFMNSETLADTLEKYKKILNLFNLEPASMDNFYTVLKNLVYNDAYIRAFYDDLERKLRNKVYYSSSGRREYLRGQNCLIIGGGPCGQRLAIELQLLGARVLVVEKRDSNTVNTQYVHLWPFVVHDLKALACQFIHPKIDFTTTDYIQVKKLELILFKIALILGCDYENNVEFYSLCPMSLKKIDEVEKIVEVKKEESPMKEEASVTLLSFFRKDSNKKKEEDKKEEKKPSVENKEPEECCCNLHLVESKNQFGAFAHFNFNTSEQRAIDKLNRFCFNIIIDAGGRQTVLGNCFTKKKSQSKLEIVIACNFINRNSKAVRLASLLSSVDQFSHPHLFQILYEITGVDLVNYCLYRGDTYYFVMIPKKQSLLNRGVLIEDKRNPKDLFSSDNISQTELLSYAKSAGIFLIGLDDLEFAMNSKGETDCKIFDFTSSSSSENSCCMKGYISKNKCCKNPEKEIRYGSLLIGLCGDSLIDSFWPIGSTPGRGFLSTLDTAWICRQFGINRLYSFKIDENEYDLLKVIAEREMIYGLLPNITSKNIIQQYNDYTIDPKTRYPKYSLSSITPGKYRHLLNPKLKIKNASGQFIYL